MGLLKRNNRWGLKGYLGILLFLIILSGLAVFLYRLIWSRFFTATKDLFSPQPVSLCDPALDEVFLNTTTTDWQILFNEPGETQSFSSLIVDYINQAQETIELAVFSMNSPQIISALGSAAQRGVQVSIVLDDFRKSSHDELLRGLPATVKRLDIDNGQVGQSASMHHKFIIIDRQTANRRLVFGSYNFTSWQDYDTAFLFSTQETSLVKAFGQEFERLEGGFSGVKKLSLAEYSPFVQRLASPSGYLDLWWSPGIKHCSANDTIRNLISQAEKSIDIIIWEFTEKKMALSLLAKARQGVRVRLIVDNYNLNNTASVFSELIRVKNKERLDNLEILSDARSEEKLRQAGALPDPDFNSFLHHHFLIIDQRVAAFGTNNWSYAGSYANDEAMLVSDRPDIVQLFQEYFTNSYQINR